MSYRNEPDAHLLAKKRQYIKQRNRFKGFVIALVSFTIIAVWILIGWTAYKLSKEHSPSSVTTEPLQTEALTTAAVTDEVIAPSQTSFYENAGRETLEIAGSNVYNGSLIIVNNEIDRAYRATDADIVTLLGAKSSCYKIVDNSIRLERKAFNAAEEMFKAFNTETGGRNYHLRLAHFEEASDRCTAEHLTGYAFDVNIYDGTPTNLADAEPPYDWIYTNASKYGYILSNPDSDSDHFRYVGKGHSMYITENGLSLDEYIGVLQRHKYGEKHLTFSYDGVDYECFYVQFDNAADSITVEIPEKTAYILSGDNVSGVVVTLYK